MEMAAKKRKKDGSKAGRCPGGSERGGVQEEGCDHRSLRGKADKEEKTEKQAPALGVRARRTFRKADWVQCLG